MGAKDRPRYQTALKLSKTPPHAPGFGRTGILSVPFSKYEQEAPDMDAPRGFPEMPAPGGGVSHYDRERKR